MISLEQIHQLQSKVNRAVERMAELQEENDLLQSKLTGYEHRIVELENFIEEFRSEQKEIEEGIISALTHLDSLEEAVGGLSQGNAIPHGPVPVLAATFETDLNIENDRHPNDNTAPEHQTAPEAIDSAAPVDEQHVEVAFIEDASQEMPSSPDYETVEENAQHNQQLDIF